MIFVGLSVYSDQCRNEQLENTVYLNQYRLGSKILTASVQSYAVTGDSTYSDNYNKSVQIRQNAVNIANAAVLW